MSELERTGAGLIAVVVPLFGIVIKHEYAWWIWLWLGLGVLVCAFLLPDRDEKTGDEATPDRGTTHP